MSTVLDNAKEATYTAVGLQVLMLDELGERFSAQREQLDERFAEQREQLQEQLEIARKHGTDARDRIEPAIQKGWETAESTVDRFAKLTPAPFDSYVTESFARIREFMGAEAEAVAEAPKAKKAPAKKAPAKKAAAKK